MSEQIELRLFKDDSKLIGFILVYFFINTLNLFMKSGIKAPRQYWGIISIAGSIVITIALIRCFRVLIRKTGKAFICLEMISFLMFIISYLREDIIVSLLFKDAFWTMLVGIPIANATCAVTNKQRLLDSLHALSYVLIALLSYNLLSIQYSGGQYDMATGYALVIPVLVLLQFYFKKKKGIDLIISLFSIVEILVFASRGALLPIMLCLFMNLFFYEEKKWKRLAYIVILFMAIFFVFSRLEFMITWLNTVLRRRNLNSYSLQRLVNGSFLENEARTALYKYYIEKIKEKLIIGWGITGGWISEGSGPHNMILEIILAFGIVLGGLFSLYILLQFVKVLFWGHNHNDGLTIIFALYSIVLLFFSGNWMQKPELFIFLGLSAGCRGRILFKSEVIQLDKESVPYH